MSNLKTVSYNGNEVAVLSYETLVEVLGEAGANRICAIYGGSIIKFNDEGEMVRGDGYEVYDVDLDELIGE